MTIKTPEIDHVIIQINTAGNCHGSRSPTCMNANTNATIAAAQPVIAAPLNIFVG